MTHEEAAKIIEKGITDIKIKTNWIMKRHYGLQSPPSASKGRIKEWLNFSGEI